MSWSLLRMKVVSVLVLVLGSACLASSSYVESSRDVVSSGEVENAAAAPEQEGREGRTGEQCGDELSVWTVSAVMESVPECEAEDPCLCSVECMESGACSYNDELAMCSPASEEHCRQSRVCEEEGRCDYGEVYDGFRGVTWPRCYSRNEATVEAARTDVQRSLERASNVLLREALRLARDEGQVRGLVVRVRDQESWTLDHTWVRVGIDSSGITGEPVSYDVDCEGFVASLRRVQEPRELRQGEYRVLVDPLGVRTADGFVYDHGDDLCQRFHYEAREMTSWVGPVWSVDYERWWSDAMGRGYGSQRLEAFDLRTGEAAPLDLMVEAETIVAALREDPWIRDRLDRLDRLDVDVEGVDDGELASAVGAFVNARTLAEIEEALGRILGFEDSWSRWNLEAPFGGYSFAEYDVERDRVAMRLEIRHSRTRPPEPPVTLGLWVQPRDEYREDFRRAHDEGWLMSGEASVPESNVQLTVVEE